MKGTPYHEVFLHKSRATPPVLQCHGPVPGSQCPPCPQPHEPAAQAAGEGWGWGEASSPWLLYPMFSLVYTGHWRGLIPSRSTLRYLFVKKNRLENLQALWELKGEGKSMVLGAGKEHRPSHCCRLGASTLNSILLEQMERWRPTLPCMALLDLSGPGRGRPQLLPRAPQAARAKLAEAVWRQGRCGGEGLPSP